MNEFNEKNFNYENENDMPQGVSYNNTEAYGSENNFDGESDKKVIDAEYTESSQNGWNKDDYQNALAVKRISEKNKKKKFGMKKYVAAATAAAVLNMAILGGIFSVGYYMGNHKYSSIAKNSVVQSMNESKNSSASGAKKTVESGQELSTVDISKKVGPSVVGITSQIQSGMSIFGTATTSEGSGSGIIISDDGYVVTNNHVIDGATKVTITLNTGSVYDAKVIGKDDKTDLAVIKFEPKESIAVAELGDSTKLEVGEKAVAIGNPLGMEFFGSTTQGIISAVNRTITVENRTMNVIQTDAAINAGNSGGALVNSYGQVIGINAVKISSSSVEGMGFAIPISEATPVISDLMQYGYVKGRPVIGISSRDVTEYMSARQGWPQGVQVMAVQQGSGADVAGLEQGDIIIKADGKEIKSVDGLNKIKDTHKPGEFISMEVYKYSTGLNQKVSVKLSEERPESSK